MIASIGFLCPQDGQLAQVSPILTNKGERQAIVCASHGVLAWVGGGPVGGFGGGQTAIYNATATRLDQLAPGEYAVSQTGAFTGVWAARPPDPAAAVVIVPTEYAVPASGFPSVGDPALSVSQPFTGAWRGRLSAGVWYRATDIL